MEVLTPKIKKGIVLPEKIGDVIICLPIAKHFYDLGYELYWPICNKLISNFKSYVDYVNFIPLYSNDKINESFTILKGLECEILDLSFNSSGSWNNENTKKYKNQMEKSFDEFRYDLANVDFNKKWDLKFRRNVQKEEELYKKLINKEKYAVIQKHSSDCVIKTEINYNGYDGQILEIKPYTESVLDWITILEKADRICIIESCFNNLIDQLNIKNNKQILLLKHGYYGEQLKDGRFKGVPVLRNNWTRI